MSRAVVFLLLLTLTGCSVDQRLIRLRAQHPDRYQQLCLVQYVTATDTVITPYRVVDTFLIRTDHRDTIIMEREKIRMKYIRRPEYIYLQAECLPDTIVNTVQVPMPVQVEKFKPRNFWQSVAPGALLVLLLVGIVGFVKYKWKSIWRI